MSAQGGTNGPLLSFKAFVDMQPFPMERHEAQMAYDDYKQDFDKKQAEIFFGQHFRDCWFTEKYDPE